MLKNNKKKAWIKGSAFSSVVLATTFLVACGGGDGGSGSGGGVTTALAVTSPEESAIVTLSSEDFTINATNCTGLKVFLNNIDVTAPFSSSCVDGKASAAVSALSTYLVDGSNTLRASIAGSGTPERKFTGDIVSGDIVFTTVSNSTTPNTLPVSGDDVSVNGVTRKEGLTSLKIRDPDNNEIPFSVKGKAIINSAFKVPSIDDLSVETRKDTTPDFSVVAQYSTKIEPVTTSYFINGRQFETLGGVQINNTAFTKITPILGQMLSVLVKDNLKNLKSVTPSDKTCMLFPDSMKIGNDNQKCGVKVINIGRLVEDKLNADIELTLSIDGSPSDVNTIALKGVMNLNNFKVDIEIPVTKNGVDLGKVATRLTLDKNAHIAVRLFAKKNKDGSASLNFSSVNPVEFVAEFESAVGSSCLPPVEGEGSLCSNFKEDEVDKSISAKLDEVKKQVSDLIEGFPLTPFSEGDSKTYGDLLAEKAKFKPTIAIRKVNESEGECTYSSDEGLTAGANLICLGQTIKPGVLKTAKDTGDVLNHGGLIALSGGAEVVSDAGAQGLIKSALGTVMNINPVGFIANEKLSNGYDISVALTENMLNQALMATYQSGKLKINDIKNKEIKVSALVATVNVVTKVNSVPSLSLSNTDTGLWINIPQVEVSVTMAKDFTIPIFGTIKKDEILATATIDLKALMSLLPDGKKLPTLKVDADRITAMVVEADVKSTIAERAGFNDQALKIYLQESVASLMSSELDSLGAGLIPQLANIPVDVEGFLTQEKEGEGKNPNYTNLREDLPKTFKLDLKAIDVDNKETAVHLNGNLKDDDSSTDSLFSITFCSSSKFASDKSRNACK